MQTVPEDLARLQPAKPGHYRLPAVVQPQWRLSDLWRRRHTDETEALRQRLCAAYGVRHCLLLDRARSGIFLLCKAFELNGEWIITSLMHRPTAVVLHNHCAGVVFADVDDYLTIDPESAARMISPRTSAILATHTYGKAADVTALRQLADRHDLVLIENTVHMAGNTDTAGRRLGSWGDAAVVSFNVDKPLGAVLGGALLTSRDDIWEAVSEYPLGPANGIELHNRIIATYAAYRLKPIALKLPFGRKHQAAVDGVGEIEQLDIAAYEAYTPRRIHPLQARVALACLEREPDMVVKRRENARRLNKRLQNDQRFLLPESTAERPHTYTYYPLIVRHGSRFELGCHLAAAGIESKWRLAPLHLQNGFRESEYAGIGHSETIWSQHLLVPAGVSTSTEQIDYLGDAIMSW